jgi:branched-chain amino acid transport system substrate-binding protein
VTVLAVLTLTTTGLETASCSVASTPTDTRDVVVGADLSLTGAGAEIGTALQRALQLQADQLNAAHALGARKVRVEVKDNRSDKGGSITNVNDFANESDVVAVITRPCDDCVQQIATTANDRQVPVLALAGASAMSVPLDQRKFVFKLGPNAPDDAATLVTDLRAANVHKIALITTDDLYGQDGRTATLNETVKAGIAVSAKPTIKPTDTDFGATVAVATEAKPDALVVWAYPAQAAQLAVATRSAGFHGKLYFDAAAGGELFLPTAVGAAVEDTTLVFTQILAIDDVVAATPAKAARKQWFRDYVARYGDYNGYASFAADALQIVVNAIVKSGSTDRLRIRDSVETTQMDGLTGPIRITPANHSGLTPQALTLLIARNGRWRLVG